MSEQDPGQFPSPTDYQQAAAQQGQSVPYSEAAAQSVGQVVDTETSQATDAGATMEQIRQQVTRDVLLPMETRINEMMDAAKAQQDTLQAQIAQLQAQLKATQAQVGPPAFTLYANSAAQRVRSLAAANPALAPAFAPVVDAADKLAAGAKAVADGSADSGTLEKLAAPVERFFTRQAPHVEGASTVVAELGHLAEEVLKIAA
jgi:uncharacterized phage infection (PIP) family protein YhgE